MKIDIPFEFGQEVWAVLPPDVQKCAECGQRLLGANWRAHPIGVIVSVRVSPGGEMRICGDKGISLNPELTFASEAEAQEAARLRNEGGSAK